MDMANDTHKVIIKSNDIQNISHMYRELNRDDMLLATIDFKKFDQGISYKLDCLDFTKEMIFEIDPDDIKHLCY